MTWCEKCKDYVICVLTDKKPKCFTDRKTEPQNGYQTFNGTSVYVSRLEDDLQTESPCGNCQEFDCYGCKYKQTEREGK